MYNTENQVFNPFLPLNEYVPDGEPHVFGDRVYIYGSHDKEGGYTFCMLDYVAYSAPVDDLTKWRYEGVIYKKEQDPEFFDQPHMYAPDVVQGNDGRYYLYYCTSGDYGIKGYHGSIKVAVCDTPAGEYKYHGFVKWPDGKPMMKYVCFDPAVLNDNGTIRLYYGTQYDFEERPDFKDNDGYIETMMNMFGRTKEEILSYKDSIMGPSHVTLADDMLTVTEEPKHIIPYKVKGTDFEAHPFFEAASMRKVNDKYYFVYSSMQNHELCYATSQYPDKDFTFKGTIVSNGDIGIDGRTDAERLNMTGTTHGSIIEINGQWYVFYHRLTHRSDYSRQACAEKIYMDRDGNIKQARITSCGLNKGALKAEGKYSAVIACVITNWHMPHGCNSIYSEEFPAVLHYGNQRFIAGIENNTLIGFRSFSFRNTNKIKITARVEDDKTRVVYEGPLRSDDRCTELNKSVNDGALDASESLFEIRTSMDENAPVIGVIRLDGKNEWTEYEENITINNAVHDLYFTYKGKCKYQLLDIGFESDKGEDETTKEDEDYMKRAIELAKKASELGEVPIGCVIVYNGKIIGEGYNRRMMDKSTLAHAEISAIKHASEYLNDWRLEGCTMYVTLEPCQMCAGAIVQARMDKVVIGSMNPKAGCAGSIVNILENKQFNHQVNTVRGVLDNECSSILSDFFSRMRDNINREKETEF